MTEVFLVVGIYRINRKDVWVIKKKFAGLFKEKTDAQETAKYLNNTQTEIKYHVIEVEQYNNLKDFLYFND